MRSSLQTKSAHRSDTSLSENALRNDQTRIMDAIVKGKSPEISTSQRPPSSVIDAGDFPVDTIVDISCVLSNGLDQMQQLKKIIRMVRAIRTVGSLRIFLAVHYHPSVLTSLIIRVLK